MGMISAVAASCGRVSTSENETPWIVDRFDDIKVIRYEVPGFDRLPLQEKELVYYLSEAAKCGRDIPVRPKFQVQSRSPSDARNNLRALRGRPLRRRVDGFGEVPEKVWFANGIHHHYSNDKFVPEFTEEYFRTVASSIPDERFGELNDLLKRFAMRFSPRRFTRRGSIRLPARTCLSLRRAIITRVSRRLRPSVSTLLWLPPMQAIPNRFPTGSIRSSSRMRKQGAFMNGHGNWAVCILPPSNGSSIG